MGVLTNLKKDHDGEVRKFFKVATDAEVDKKHRVSAFARIVLSKLRTHTVCEAMFVQGEEKGGPHAEEIFYKWFEQGPGPMTPRARVTWLFQHGVPLRLYLYVRKSPCKNCVEVLNDFAQQHGAKFEIMKLGFQHIYKSPHGFENLDAYESPNDCAAYYLSHLRSLWVVTRFSWDDDMRKAKLDRTAFEYGHPWQCDYWDWRSVMTQPATSTITDNTTMEQPNNNNNSMQ